MSEHNPLPPVGEVHGLLPKQAWHDMVENRVALAETNGTPSSVLFIDINGMKAVNDTCGHVEGDRLIGGIGGLLSIVSLTLRTASRNPDENFEPSNDLVSFGTNTPDHADPAVIENDPGHIGGDEFAVYAETDEAGCITITERVRSAFNNYIEQPENEALKALGVGIAIGHATRQPGMTASELTALADKAMYADKRSQLPELTADQQKFLKAAKYFLDKAGLDWRSAAKY